MLRSERHFKQDCTRLPVGKRGERVVRYRVLRILRSRLVRAFA